MTFTEIVAEVLDITGRPDKLSEARNAVNTVLSLTMFKGSFRRDLVETTINNNVGEEYTGVIDLTLLNSFRKVKYIRPTTYRDFLENKEPQGVLLHGIALRNIYWIAGTKLNWTSSVISPTMEMGYFVYPPILNDAAPNHWFLDVAPAVITDLAIARIFRSIGDRQSASDYEASGANLYITIKNDLESNVEPEAT